jgi:hypothetical protein
VSTTGEKQLADPLFRPGFVMGASQRAANLDTISSGQGNLSIGAGDARFTEGSLTVNARDNTSPTATHAHAGSGLVAVVHTTGTYDWIAELSGFNDLGPNINVTTAAAASRAFSYLAIKASPGTTSTTTDQESISDSGILQVTIERRVSGDTERIADEFLFRTTDRKAFGDTEQVTDAFRLVVTSDFRVSGDTERIADAVLLVRTSDRITSADTERISDAFNFIVGNLRSSADTVNIGDGFVLKASGATFLISNDTERISDAFVTVLAAAGNLKFISTETERISDNAVLVRGTVLVTGDTEAISDAFSSGRGLIARKAIKRGRVF